jgi:hypothetical protein
VRRWFVAGVGVIVILFGVTGVVYAGWPTKPVVVQTSEGPVFQCVNGTLHGYCPFCWCG